MTVEAVICRPGPMEEVYREELGERWCFVCRKRVPFTLRVMREVEISYYEPNLTVRCTRQGHIDGDCFPGTAREWN